MNIDEVATKTREHLTTIGCLTIPGMMILDVVFDRGLFSDGINDLYDFILYCFWAVALSYAFTFLPWYLTHNRHILSDCGRGESDHNTRVMTFCFPVILLAALSSCFAYKMILHLLPMLTKDWLGIHTPHLVYFFTSTIIILLEKPLVFIHKMFIVRYLAQE